MSELQRVSRFQGIVGPDGRMTRSAPNLDPTFFTSRPFGSGELRDAANVHAWTYAAVKKRGQAIGSIPPLIMEGDRDDARHVGAGHPIQAIFDKPNPFYGAGTFWRLWERFVALKGRVLVLLDPLTEDGKVGDLRGFGQGRAQVAQAVHEAMPAIFCWGPPHRFPLRHRRPSGQLAK